MNGPVPEATAPARPRKPEWLKVRAPGGLGYAALKERVTAHGLHTVCQEARCPNIGECWNEGTGTVMILGDVCTRGCRFCAVTTGRPTVTDLQEPERVGRAVETMRLQYVVITSVNRDDLDDGGAALFAQTITAVRARSPEILIEVLVPDFQGVSRDVHTVLAAGPEVFAHNIETVERLQRTVRDARAGYRQSLDVLGYARQHLSGAGGRAHGLVKTSVQLGHGETEAEVLATLADLRAVGCDVVTFGQYLQPSPKHLPVRAWVTPSTFDHYRDVALAMGFVYCASGPLVRSSYRAGEHFVRGYLAAKRAPEVA